MPFGTFVIGPPGSGKTTFCVHMLEFMKGLKRKAILVNLDPANELLESQEQSFIVDIREFVSLAKVQEVFELGPNGALVYCMEYLEKKGLEWLEEKLKPYKDCYWLIDCPGQIELYTHCGCVRNILQFLERKLACRIVVVNLVDSVYCLDANNYLSASLISLSSMIRLEMPHVNVLSKIDKLKHHRLDFRVSEYQNFGNKEELLELLPQDSRLKSLNQAIVDLLDDWNMVSYETCDVTNKKSMYHVLETMDKANGFQYVPSNDIRNIIQKLKSDYESPDDYIGTDDVGDIDEWN